MSLINALFAVSVPEINIKLIGAIGFSPPDIDIFYPRIINRIIIKNLGI